jgi:hypothetical protein
VKNGSRGASSSRTSYGPVLSLLSLTSDTSETLRGRRTPRLGPRLDTWLSDRGFAGLKEAWCVSAAVPKWSPTIVGRLRCRGLPAAGIAIFSSEYNVCKGWEISWSRVDNVGKDEPFNPVEEGWDDERRISSGSGDGLGVILCRRRNVYVSCRSEGSELVPDWPNWKPIREPSGAGGERWRAFSVVSGVWWLCRRMEMPEAVERDWWVSDEEVWGGVPLVLRTFCELPGLLLPLDLLGSGAILRPWEGTVAEPEGGDDILLEIGNSDKWFVSI